MRLLLSVSLGALFALGLVLARMTDPAKVIGFLDFLGAWDPSLAFVMLGAIGVYAPFYFATRKWRRPVFGERFELPLNDRLDARLIGGAALFGVGWGLAGYCPGPALVAVGAGRGDALLFTAAMSVGMFLYRWARRPAGELSARVNL